MSATNKDLTRAQRQRGIALGLLRALGASAVLIEIGRASCRERVYGTV